METEKKQNALDAGKKRLEEFRRKKAGFRKSAAGIPVEKLNEAGDRGGGSEALKENPASKNYDTGGLANMFSVDLSAYLSSNPEPPPGRAHEHSLKELPDISPVADVPGERSAGRVQEDHRKADEEEGCEARAVFTEGDQERDGGAIGEQTDNIEVASSHPPDTSVYSNLLEGVLPLEGPLNMDREDLTVAVKSRIVGSTGDPFSLKDPDLGFFTPDDTPSSSPSARSDIYRVSLRSRSMESGAHALSQEEKESEKQRLEEEPAATVKNLEDGRARNISLQEEVKMFKEQQSALMDTIGELQNARAAYEAARTVLESPVSDVEARATGHSLEGAAKFGSEEGNTLEARVPSGCTEDAGTAVQQLQEELASTRAENQALQSSLRDANMALRDRDVELHNVRNQTSQMAAEVCRLSQESEALRGEVLKSEQRLSAVREKLTMAVKKGKEVVQQRELLKGSLAERAAEMDLLGAENMALKLEQSSWQLALEAAAQRVETLEAELTRVSEAADVLSMTLKEERSTANMRLAATFPEETPTLAGDASANDAKEKLGRLQVSPTSIEMGSLQLGCLEAMGKEGVTESVHLKHVDLNGGGDTNGLGASYGAASKKEEKAADGAAASLADLELQLVEAIRYQQTLEEELAVARLELIERRSARADIQEKPCKAVKDGEELESLAESLEAKPQGLEEQVASVKSEDSCNQAAAEVEALRARAASLETELQHDRDRGAADLRAKMEELRVSAEKELQQRSELASMEALLSANTEEVTALRLKVAELEDAVKEEEVKMARLQVEADFRMEAVNSRLQQAILTQTELLEKVGADLAGALAKATGLEQALEEERSSTFKLEETVCSLELLEREREALTAQLQKADSQLGVERALVDRKSNELALVREQVERLGVQLHEEQQKVEASEVTLEGLKRQHSDQLETILKKLEEVKDRLYGLEEESTNLKDTVAQKDSQLEDAGKRLQEVNAVNEEIGKLQTALDGYREELEKKNSEIPILQGQLATMQEILEGAQRKLEFQEKQLMELEEGRLILRSTLEDTRTELLLAQSEVESKAKEMIELKRTREEASELARKLEKSLASADIVSEEAAVLKQELADSRGELEIAMAQKQELLTQLHVASAARSTELAELQEALDGKCRKAAQQYREELQKLRLEKQKLNEDFKAHMEVHDRSIENAVTVKESLGQELLVMAKQNEGLEFQLSESQEHLRLTVQQRKEDQAKMQNMLEETDRKAESEMAALALEREIVSAKDTIAGLQKQLQEKEEAIALLAAQVRDEGLILKKQVAAANREIGGLQNLLAEKDATVASVIRQRDEARLLQEKYIVALRKDVSDLRVTLDEKDAIMASRSEQAVIASQALEKEVLAAREETSEVRLLLLEKDSMLNSLLEEKARLESDVLSLSEEKAALREALVMKEQACSSAESRAASVTRRAKEAVAKEKARMAEERSSEYVKQQEREAAFAAETSALQKALESAEQELASAEEIAKRSTDHLSEVEAKEALALAEVQSLSAIIESSEARAQEFEDAVSAQSTAAQSAQARLEAALTAEAKSMEALQTLRENFLQAGLDLESLLGQDCRLLKALVEAQAAEGRAAEECSSLRGKLHAAQAEVATLKGKLDEMTAMECSKARGVEAVRAKVEHLAWGETDLLADRGPVRAINPAQALAKSEANVAELQDAPQEARSERRGEGESADSAAELIFDLASEARTAGAENEADNEAVGQLREDLTRAHEQIAATREKLRKAVSKGKNIQEQKVKLERDLAAAEAEVSILKKASSVSRADAEAAFQRAVTAEKALNEVQETAAHLDTELQCLKEFEWKAQLLEVQIGEMQEQNEADMKAVMEARELAKAKEEAQSQLLEQTREESLQLLEQVASISHELSAAKHELQVLCKQLEEKNTEVEELREAAAKSITVLAATVAAEKTKQLEAPNQSLDWKEAEVGKIRGSLAAANQALLQKHQDSYSLRGDLSSAAAVLREGLELAEKKVQELTATTMILEEETYRLKTKRDCVKAEVEELKGVLVSKDESLVQIRAQLSYEQQAAAAHKISLEEAGRQHRDEAGAQAQQILNLMTRLGALEANAKATQIALMQREAQLGVAQERLHSAESLGREACELQAALREGKDEMARRESEALGREEAALAQVLELVNMLATKDKELQDLQDKMSEVEEARDLARIEARRLEVLRSSELEALQKERARESKELQAKVDEAERRAGQRAQEVSTLQASAQERDRLVQSLAAAKNKALTKLTTTVDKLKDIQAQSEAVVAEAESRLQAQAEELAGVKGDFAKLRASLEATIEGHTSAKHRLEAEGRALRDEMAARDAAAAELRRELGGSLNEVQALRDQLTVKEGVLDDLRRQLELAAQDKASSVKLDELRQQLQAASSEAENLRASLRWRDTELEELRGESEGLLAEAESWRSSTEQKAEQLEECRHEAVQLHIEAQALRSALEARETELGRVSAEAGTAVEAVSRWEGRVEAMRREMDDLRTRFEQQRRADLRQAQNMQASTSAPSLVVSPRFLRKPPNLRVDLESPPVPGSPVGYDNSDESKPEFCFKSIVSAYPSLPRRVASLTGAIDRLR